MSTIDLISQPVRIDGVSQEVYIEERLFKPEGVLEHQFIPLETVIIKEIGNDLIYSCNYFAVERYFKVFLPRHIYDRMITKFLQGQEIVIDYTTPKKPKVFLPRDTKVNGFTSMYRSTVDDLKSMNAEELESHLSQLGYDPMFGRM
jgi:hypothetical protein